MENISREQLKAEIDQLDSAYLGLAYRVIRQFPRQPQAQPVATPSPSTFSERWRGKFTQPNFSPEALAADPKLAYLVDRYHL
jgi:hypothetical protein